MPPNKKYKTDQLAARERRTDHFIQNILHEIIDHLPDEGRVSMDGSVIAASENEDESCVNSTSIHENDKLGMQHLYPF